MREVIDASHGHGALKAHLQTFLEQCNLKVNILLTAYREANRAARKEPAPVHFNSPYRFDDYVEPEFDKGRLKDAENERQAIGEIIDDAIEAIGSEYDRAIRRLATVDELQNRVQETAQMRREREASRTTMARSDNLESRAEAGLEEGDRPAHLAVVASKEEKT